MNDDPVGHASTRVMAWTAVAAAAAEAFAQIAAVRARERRQHSLWEAGRARMQLRTRYLRDRGWWEPVLDTRRWGHADVRQVGLAWASAYGWRGDPEADKARSLAEARLRALRPDVMRLYDAHVADGVDPVVAMHRVAPLMDRPPAHPMRPERPELAVPTSNSEKSQEAFPDVCSECLGVKDHRPTCSESLPDKVRDVRRERLLTAVKAAEEFFVERVDHAWAAGYVKDRGLGACLDERSPWAVGWAPRSWSALTEHLRGLGFTDREMLDAGLAVETRRGTVADRFRDRLMVSVRNAEGETVGFTGRANPFEPTNQRVPKYLNSPDSELYHKGELVLGLWEQSDRQPSAEGRVCLVEGPFDAMAVSLASGGRLAGMAPCGTALTATQAAQLGERVVVAFDGDDAGRNAAVKVWQLLPLAEVATLPDGTDPAGLYHSRASALSHYLSEPERRPLVEKVLDRQIAGRDLTTPEGRTNALHAVVPLLAALPAAAIQQQVVYAAGRIGVDVMTVSQEVVDAISKPEELAADVRPRGREAAAGAGR